MSMVVSFLFGVFLMMNLADLVVMFLYGERLGLIFAIVEMIVLFLLMVFA